MRQDWTELDCYPTSVPQGGPPDPLREEMVRTDSMRQLHMNYACFPKAGDWLRASAGPPLETLIGHGSSKWTHPQRQVPASPHHQVSTPTSPCLGVDSEEGHAFSSVAKFHHIMSLIHRCTAWEAAGIQSISPSRRNL